MWPPSSQPGPVGSRARSRLHAWTGLPSAGRPGFLQCDRWGISLEGQSRTGCNHVGQTLEPLTAPVAGGDIRGGDGELERVGDRGGGHAAISPRMGSRKDARCLVLRFPHGFCGSDLRAISSVQPLGRMSDRGAVGHRVPVPMYSQSIRSPCSCVRSTHAAAAR